MILLSAAVAQPSPALDLGIPLVISLLTLGLVFFGLSAYQTARAYKNLPQVERTAARIEEEERRKSRSSPKKRLQAWLVRRGYTGDLFPLLAAGSFGYLAVALVLRFLGISGYLTYFAALPATFGVALFMFNAAETRRRRLFARQLIQMLALMAGQVESGVGPATALERVVSTLPDPLRREMLAAIATTAAQGSLVDALKELYERYPTRGFKMFIATLEIDAKQGGRIEPALRQAATILQNDQNLAEEAMAELSQTRTDFIVIVAIILGIVVTMFAAAGDQPGGSSGYTSGPALIALVVGGLNFLFGLFRAYRILNRARGEL